MSKIKLTRRLNTIASFVDSRKIADVGCDHGKLTAYLFENKLIDYALVSDISAMSLSKAVSLLLDMKVNFEHIVCDGIYKYAKADLAIIAGMGGEEIIKILKHNASTIKHFILGPQHSEVELKKYLVRNNYLIETDIFVCDNGKFYNIIKCVKSKSRHTISHSQLLFGQNIPSADYADYIDNRLDKVSNIISYMPYFKSLKMRKYLRDIKKAKLKLEKDNERNTRISTN